MTCRWALAALVCGVWLNAAAAVDVTGKVTVAAKGDPTAWRMAAMAEPAAELPADLATVPVAADGSFTLPNVTLGTVWAVPYLGRFMDQRAMPAARIASAEPLAIEVTGLRKQLVLTVLGPNRAPLGRSLTAHLFGPWGAYDASTGGTKVGADGTATYENLPAGAYDLWVDTVQDAPSPTEAAAVLTRHIEVTASAQPQRVTVNLPAAGALRGTLRLGAGQARGWVVSTGTGGEPQPGERSPEAAYAAGAANGYTWAEVAEDGSFTLPQLPEGPVQLDVRRPGETRAWWSFEADIKPGAVTDAGELRVPAESWKHLFGGRDMSGWADAALTGHKPAWVGSRRLFVPLGEDLSGVVYKGGEIPKWNYEVTLQGMRTEGHDFWCGLTFRVGDDPCTLVMGGWGGSVTGLSSIDGEDASANSTSTFVEYEDWRWYRARVRVTPKRIQCWLDDKRIIDQAVPNHKISVRWEVEPTIPFGIATWRTTGALRDIRVRELPTEG